MEKGEKQKLKEEFKRRCKNSERELKQNIIENKKIKKTIKECNQLRDSMMSKYFSKRHDKKHNLKELLEALQQYYIENKIKNSEFYLSFKQYVESFPLSDSLKGTNFRRQHVFEQICRIMVMFNYNDTSLGNKKVFFKNKLEDIPTVREQKKDVWKNNKEILEKMKINGGSKEGSVDIFYKIPSGDTIDETCEWQCECPIISSKPKTNEKTTKDTYILIQNKYLSNEVSDSSKYDIPKIIMRASRLKEIEGITEENTKLILMVNNAQMVDKKLRKARNEDIKFVDKIYGIEGTRESSNSLNEWFQKLLFDLFNTKNVSEFLKLKGENPENQNKTMIPRFHQKFIVTTSEKYIASGKKKLIWGAVPRSGKSYMIGSLIDNRQSIKNHDVLLILGAPSETKGQFVKMFKEHSNFNNLNIITSDSGKSIPGKNNVFILSQQWFKKDKINKEGKFKDSFKKPPPPPKKWAAEKYKNLFDEKRTIDFYFDEIHKGGTTTLGKSIINSIIDVKKGNKKVLLFVMVTATFAKPQLAYDKLITEDEPITIEWGYKDQQLMKYIDETPDNLKIIKSSKNDYEAECIDETIDFFKVLYGSGYLNILSSEYKKHPELVLVAPNFDKYDEDVEPDEKLLNKKNNNLDEDIFKLTCNAIATENQTPYQDIFKYPKKINSLINLICKKNSKGKSSELSDKSVYHFLKNIKCPIDKPHTELWFLPDNNLYEPEDICEEEIEKQKKRKKKSKQVSADEKEKPESKPMIEPITRGIGMALRSDEYIRENYLVVSVHNQDEQASHYCHTTNVYDCKNMYYIFDGSCNHVDKKNMVEGIKNIEWEAKRQNKSLIILVGGKLRLGVSLPCADIAFNFDNMRGIDINYQTMFRVLTESPQKKYGYYVDFNPDRMISFVYDFYEIYKKGLEKDNEIEEKLEEIQSLVISDFNINGLSMNQIKSDIYIDEYKTLMDRIKMWDTKSYLQHQKHISQSIKSLIEDSDIKEFKDIVKDISVSKLPTTKTEVLRKKKGKIPTRKKQQEGEEDFEEEDVDDDDVYDKMSIIIPDITSILALFSNYYKCEKLDACFDNSIKNIDKLENLCECHETEEKSIIANKIKTLYTGDSDNPFCDKTKLINLLKIIKGYIMKKENLKIKNKLELSFLHIKDSFKGDKPIITRENMNPEKIIKLIEDYLPIRKQEKDKYGEVFTPPQLINEMFDKLPKSVWKDPKLKWLDPANGIGNFPILAYERLMKELESVYPEKTKRSNHIIKNMLYMVELNEKNVAISRKIFGKDANIFCGSFLSKDNKSLNSDVLQALGIDKFDVIMGNPPYQYKKSGNKKSQAIWPNFVENSVGCLKENGYLVFIHPIGWRNIDGEFKKVFDLIQKRDLQHLTMRTFKDGSKTFGGSGTNFDYYCLKNTFTTKNKTKINDIYRKQYELDLNNYTFIPSGKFNIFNKLIKGTEKVSILYSSNNYETRPNKSKYPTSQDKKGKFIHKVVNSITKKDGPKFIYTTTKNEMFVPKVIWSNGLGTYPIVDNKGDYGLTQFSYAIKDIPKNLEFIKNAMNDPVFIELMEYVKFTNNKYNYKIIGAFKKDFWKEFDYKLNSSKTPKEKTKTKRCPRGTHKNKKTGKCEKKKIKLILSTGKGKYRTFKKRKHKKNKSQRR